MSLLLIANLRSTQVPISINVLDECTNALFGNTTEEVVNADIFAGAEADVSFSIALMFVLLKSEGSGLSDV